MYDKTTTQLSKLTTIQTFEHLSCVLNSRKAQSLLLFSLSIPMSVSIQSSLGSSMDSSECYTEDSAATKSIITASVNKAVEDPPQEEIIDMSQSLGMRSRHFNKDITFHQKRNLGTIPNFSQIEVNEMRRVVVKKNMQLLKHHQLQPIWVRMGMQGKYPKTQDRLITVAKMKQFAVLSLELVAHTDVVESNTWVSSC